MEKISNASFHTWYIQYIGCLGDRRFEQKLSFGQKESKIGSEAKIMGKNKQSEFPLMVYLVYWLHGRRFKCGKKVLTDSVVERSFARKFSSDYTLCLDAFFRISLNLFFSG